MNDILIHYYFLPLSIFINIIFIIIFNKKKSLISSTLVKFQNLQVEFEKIQYQYKISSEENSQFFLKNSELSNEFNQLNILICNREQEIDKLKTIIEKNKLDFDLSLKTQVKKAREDALSKSRSVIRGQASEHLAPFVIPNTNPKDYRFMGNPIDYICYDGLSDVIDKVSDQIKTVRFIDIKTGKSNLNKTQRRIRDAIKANRVSFETINLDEVLNDNPSLKNETSNKK